MQRAALVLALAVAAATGSACGARYVRTPVYDDGGVSVTLRAEKRVGKLVPRAFSHPATISGIRVAHVLARIDVRMGSEEGGERTPAFPTASLYQVGDAVARALAKAAPEQEVVVKALRQEKRFGIFHAKYLTTFVAWMRGGDLIIHLSRVEWQLPKEDEETLPEPYADRVVQTFKVLATEGVVPTGDQELAADWRNPVFRDATSVRVGADGKLLRRQVLMESETAVDDETKDPEPAALPADLPAETLRALAELQDRRTRGEISETTYHRERRDLLRAVEDRRKPKPPTPEPAAAPVQEAEPAPAPAAEPAQAPTAEPAAEPKAEPEFDLER